MRVLKSFIVHSVAPAMPSRICSSLYRWVGLNNCDNVRNNTYIQNIDAIFIGKNSFINKFCKVYNGFDGSNPHSHVQIGNNVTIGYGTTIITSTHSIGGVPTEQILGR